MPSTTMTGNAPRGRIDPPGNGDRQGQFRPGMSAASLFLVLIVFWVFTRVEYVIVIALFGLLLGTILEGPVRRIQERHIPRPAAIAMVYAAILGMLVLLVVLIVPVVGDQIDTFRDQIPSQIQELQTEWETSSNGLLSNTGAPLLGRAVEFLDGSSDETVTVSTDAVQTVIPVVSSITAGVIGVITTLVITFYYLMEKAFIRKLVIDQLDPRRQPRIDKIWQDVENKVGGWMRGQLTLCLIIGVIATISYGFLDIRFWPLLGLWAGITEIIPIVGPWIGGIPAVIVALTQGWEKAIAVAIVIICMQTLENWFLVPRVMRGAVGLSPLTVFIAILAGTQFMGITGAILAIPIAASIQVILTDYFGSRQVTRDSDHQQSGWRWMLSRASFSDEIGNDAERSPSPSTQHHGRQQTISKDIAPKSSTATAVIDEPKPTPNRPSPKAPAAKRKWNPFDVDGDSNGQRVGSDTE